MSLVLCLAAAVLPVHGSEPADAAAIIEQLEADGHTLRRRPDGTLRFLRLGDAPLPGVDPATSEKAQAAAFLARFGAAFGVREPDELVPEEPGEDGYAGRRLSFRQQVGDVPVLGGVLRFHFDGRGGLRVVQGSFVRDLRLDLRPRLSAEEAAASARRYFEASAPAGLPPATARVDGLFALRAGMARGTPGADHLAYRVDVRAGPSAGEILFIDAHSGKLVEKYSSIRRGAGRRTGGS